MGVFFEFLEINLYSVVLAIFFPCFLTFLLFFSRDQLEERDQVDEFMKDVGKAEPSALVLEPPSSTFGHQLSIR
jgi:hypothetical protein